MTRSWQHHLLVALLTWVGFSGSASAAKPALTTGTPPISIQEVIDAPGKPAEELFRRAQIWFDSQDAKHLLKDPEIGRLKAELSIPFGLPGSTNQSSAARLGMTGALTYSVTVEVQDAKYRVTIGDFVHEGTDGVRHPSADELVMLGLMAGPKRIEKFSMGSITSDSICPCEEQRQISGNSEKLWRRKNREGWRLDGWTKAQALAADEGARVLGELKETISATGTKTW